MNLARDFHFDSDFNITMAIPILALLMVFCLNDTIKADEGTKKVAQALKLHLHKDRFFHKLLHYQATLSGHRSLIDDPKFFFSKNGKKDPKSELIATIKVLFTSHSRGNNHPTCRFPLRFGWLIKQLKIDGIKIDALDCPLYLKFLKIHRSDLISIVFPTGYFNNPASMFGHTFLRLDKSKGSRLISNSISYGALATDGLGPSYVFKGIFGFYKGYLSSQPYYEKINTYSNIEYRDMWEYTLNFTPAQVARIIDHIWELNGIYIDYYFFDENCSYMLLEILNIAKAELNLALKTKIWVTPLDTIKLLSSSDLIKSVKYRPSQINLMKHIIGLMNPHALEISHKLIAAKIAPNDLIREKLLENQKINALNLAAQYENYRYKKGKVSRPEYAKKYVAMLNARSKLGLYKYQPIEPSSPDKGHGSLRIGLLYRKIYNHRFYNLRARVAHHSFSDPSLGYQKGKHLNILDLGAAYDFNRNSLVLSDLKVLEVYSLIPWDNHLTPISWGGKIGYFKEHFKNGRERGVLNLDGFAGISWDAPRAIAYALMGPDLRILPKSEKNWGIGAKILLGYHLEILATWKVNIKLSFGRYYDPLFTRSNSIKIQQTLELVKNLAFRCDVQRLAIDKDVAYNYKVGINSYF